jgi:hypothetical protein
MKRGTIAVTWNESNYKNLLYENITYGNQISIIDDRDFKRYNIGMGYIRGQELGRELGIEGSFSWLQEINYAIHKIYPGQVLPYHRDHYVRYKEIHGIIDPNSIERIILFLEDWKPGQILGIENEILSNWNAGNWVSWQGEAVHMAANLGHNDRYTLQITGYNRA